MPKKIITVISGISSSAGMEGYLKALPAAYSNHVVLLHTEEGSISKSLREAGIPVTFLRYRGKRDLLSAFRKLVALIRKVKPDLVHTHLFEGSLLGLHAAKLCGVKKRIHTRHHSTFHHEFHPHAVKYDKWINNASTTIIAVSAIVKDVVVNREKNQESKVKVVHHGFDLSGFDDSRSDGLRNKYNISPSQPVIGMISRAAAWKGIQYVIPAVSLLIKKHPDLVLALGNLHGDYLPEIQKLLLALPEKNYRILEQEKDPCALYGMFNGFVHVPIDPYCEAFGQVYVEAMAAGLPCVFTRSGIGHELMQDKVNCLEVPYQNTDAIRTALEQILENPKMLGTEAKKRVAGHFTLDEMIRKLVEVYES